MRLRPAALVVGLLLASPALWRALVEGTMPAGTALQRTLVALVVASVGAAVLEAIVAPYVGGAGRARRAAGDDAMGRRAGDLPRPRTGAEPAAGLPRASMGSRPTTVGEVPAPPPGAGAAGVPGGAQ